MQSIPQSLETADNQSVLRYVAPLSCHSDVADLLLASLTAVGDAQPFCPDGSQYRYLVVSTLNVIFAFGAGMNTIAYRLSPKMRDIAVRTGAEPLDEVGPEWVRFTLFQPDWPTPELKFWTLKAYSHARLLLAPGLRPVGDSKNGARRRRRKL